MLLEDITDINGNVWTVKHVDTETHEDDSDEEYKEDPITIYEYDVFLNGKKVGGISYNDYFGYVYFDIAGRHTDIEHFADNHPGNKSNMYHGDEENPKFMEDIIKKYFASKTGQKHLEVLERKGLFK